MTERGGQARNHCSGNFRRETERETAAAQMLGVLKVDYHRNITLLHTALYCTQMICVMTCSAERGIHQETIESIQKNTQLQETSLTPTARAGRTCFRGQCDRRVSITKLPASCEGEEFIRGSCSKVTWKGGRWNINGAEWSAVCVLAHLISTIHGRNQRKGGSSLFQTAAVWQPAAFPWHFTGKGQEGRELLTV